MINTKLSLIPRTILNSSWNVIKGVVGVIPVFMTFGIFFTVFAKNSLLFQ
jgi:hypothetical protein